MRHRNVLLLIGGMLALTTASVPAQAQFFGPADWLLHRGITRRQGHNAGGNHQGVMDRLWTFPQARDMPAEIVVDNGIPPAPFTNTLPTGQTFTTAGAWTYPGAAQRALAFGAWPFTDSSTDKIGDYVYTPAVQSAILKNLGTARLAQLPNLGVDTDAVNDYTAVHNELANNGTVYARWSFGSQYPAGTNQGSQLVGGFPLAANQRYAVYMLFPNGTTQFADNSQHPLVQNVMVRVSWGADPNDPVTSRIFLVDTTLSGGTWLRVRTDSTDDRYFPYDGTHPITVTLYALTPDDPSDTTVYGTTPIVAADAVRFVPEAMRGDIHAGAVSGAFPPFGGLDTDPRIRTLTYFGREETAGPLILFPNLTQMAADANLNPAKFPALDNFPATLYNPTKKLDQDPNSADFNPYVPDPTNTIRTAAFYCFEDDALNRHFGKLTWRYAANSSQMKLAPEPADPANQLYVMALPSTTLDDSAAGFSTAGFASVAALAADQAYGATFHTSLATAAPATATATWMAKLPVLDTTYTILVWIPGLNTAGGQPFSSYAHYHIATAPIPNQPVPAGTVTPVDVWFNQQNTVLDGRPRAGMWRLLATGVRFPKDTSDPNNVALLASVTLSNDVPAGDPGTDAGVHTVVADAIVFLPESHAAGRVTAAPMLASSRQSNGTLTPPSRRIVTFGTTEGTQGRVWTLDAPGAGPDSTLTTPLWVYPTINKAATNGPITRPSDDPNISALNNPGDKPDGDETQATIGGKQVFVTSNAVTPLGTIASAPVYFEVQKDAANRGVFQSFTLLGSGNGRLYAFEPDGRGDFVAAAGDNPGIPGTGFRKLTWPTTGRDLWLKDNHPANQFSKYKDDPGKTYFNASPTAQQQDADFLANRIVAGAGDGHVYALDTNEMDPATRIYKFTSQTDQGKPLWQYPAATTQLDPIDHPGALTTPAGGNPQQFIFSAGGRIYAVDPNTLTSSVAALRWVYPFTSSPPGNPNAGDQPPLDANLTAPAWVVGINNNINNGNEVVFVADEDGNIYAMKSDTAGNDPNRVIWSVNHGGTHASVVFADNIFNNFGLPNPRVGRPAVLLPLDFGSLIAVTADGLQTTDGGQTRWALQDGNIGFVPVLDSSGALTVTSTSYAQRTDEAATAALLVNNVLFSFVYNGDEGIQATGEVSGIMHAYADTSATGFGGAWIPGEPPAPPGNLNGVFDLRVVNLWNGNADTPTGPYDHFATDPATDNQATTPYAELANARPDLRAGSSVTAYEWGDTITGAAWGAYAPGTAPPIVLVRFSGAGITRTVRIPGTDDATYNNNAANPPLFVYRYDNTGNLVPVPARAWVAKIPVPLGQPSNQDPQTPGSRRQMFVRAQTPNNISGLVELNIGQTADGGGNINALPTDDPTNPTTNPDSRVRYLALAHPLALTTRGGAAFGAPNIIGWTTNLTADFTELLGNANSLVQLDANNQITRTSGKDLVAPLGPISHGSSGVYTGVNGAGAPTRALYLADRSNLYPKMKVALGNVRIARNDLGWGWNPGDTSQQATGNVMNPLPWEVFPNTIPNVSPDYPNLDRTRLSMQGNGVDMALRGINLPPPLIDANGNKTLNPMALTLQVDVPRFQPANVNRTYININGAPIIGDDTNPGLCAPMRTDTGVPAQPDTTGIGRLASPSAGYVGVVRVFVGLGGAVNFSDRWAYRQMNVGVSVPPDVNIATVETTVDLGNVPQSEGYAPALPFGPVGIGPYAAQPDPWDTPGLPSFFRPFTIQNQGNVNLVNLRAAKVFGGLSVANNPWFWAKMMSDEVEPGVWASGPPAGFAAWFWNVPIWGRALSPALLGNNRMAGNIGIVTSLDHGGFPWDNLDLWDSTRWAVASPYWPGGAQPQPTLHKARAGDTAPTTFSIPDVAYGDPLGALSSAGPARIGVGVPLGTPAGTYSAQVYVYEDNTPDQWRSWINYYAAQTQTVNPLNSAVNNDGVLNIFADPNTPVFNPSALVEAFVRNPFRLKATVREARLTNGVTPGSFFQIDTTGPLGANIQPVAFRAADGIHLYWASNRMNDPAQTPNPIPADMPWFLFQTVLNAANGSLGPFGTYYDWSYETGNTRWWNPLPVNQAQYPDVTRANNLFPSVSGDIVGNPNTPLVPGTMVQNALNLPVVQYATPSLALDPGGRLWLTFQGAVWKNAGAANTAQSASLDTRTFYVPLDAAGAPDTTVNNGIPYSFANDPTQPKFGPKMVILGGGQALMFWYGGPRGRTRLFYKATPDLTDPTRWGPDVPLPTPGTLQWQADPIPVPRRLDPANPNNITSIDLIYSGVLTSRRTPETILTRYNVAGPRLIAAQLPPVINEVMVRDGATQSWYSRDLAWVFQPYMQGNPPAPVFTISVQRADGSMISPVTVGTSPTYDNATGRLFFNSALGGQVVVDPQAGMVTFTGVGPRAGDKVLVSYTPQSMRLNVTRSESGVVVPPGVDPVTGYNWNADPAFAPQPHVPSSGSNTGPIGFLDLSPDLRAQIAGDPALIQPNVLMPITRYWLFYRKTDASSTGPATIYYKTMRLMVRLPRGVLRDTVKDGNGNTIGYTVGNNVSIAGNVGPVEVDWVRGRLYFTELDEGRNVTVTFNYARQTDANGNTVVLTVPPAVYRVAWGDEISAAVKPGDQTTTERVLPTDSVVNEGQISAFKDPFQDKVWVFWSSTRAGTTDLYYMTLSPQFYAQPSQ
jgi:hypothetical protein